MGCCHRGCGRLGGRHRREASVPYDVAVLTSRGMFDRAGCSSIRFTSLETPVGSIFIGVTDAGVCDVSLNKASEQSYRAEFLRRVPEVRRDDIGLVAVAHQVQAYFSGALTRFELPLDLRHVTPFTVRVLRETRKIQFGQLTSYGAIAVRIGSLGSSRAVGGALGRNPVPIIIPCHRVISADGGIGGFTGGLRAKCVLLGLEGHEFTEPAGDCRPSGSVPRA